MKISFIILGVPLQKQSVRFAKRGNFMHKYQPKEIVDWISQARLQIINQLPQDYKIVDKPVIINKLLFVFPPQKNWPKKNLKLLEENQIIYREVKPDLDNLQKNCFDTCNGVVWTDDSQIVKICNIEKIYGTQPRIELEFESLGD